MAYILDIPVRPCQHWERYEVFKIMITVTGDQAFALQTRSFVYQVFQHIHRHFRIIQQTHGFAFAPLLKAFSQCINKFTAYFLIQVQFSITGKLNGKASMESCSKMKKISSRLYPDNVIQKDNKLQIISFRQYDKPGKVIRYFDERVPRVFCFLSVLHKNIPPCRVSSGKGHTHRSA